ncbi:DoxX family protein [Bowmanella sp. Y26]|uniref:HvfX family Cu-binding RiPP maturation protein n=1 Tax=Bowmanella yangjiangensis TaxID=2811230 RepID=UPI001BDDBE85|nr:DoxX family protein [Bowmanella yangjiangensis]MBT1065378.1 DoxX family protein [Bowmanella yangjiangensis]
MPIFSYAQKIQHGLNQTRKLDFLGPLSLRLYLVPIFWMAGMNKLSGFEDVVAWFGNHEWGLGLPFPYLMAWLATWTELLGAACLLLGLGVRYISIPLMITMLVAAFSAHWQNGWQAIADPHGMFANQQVLESADKLAMAKQLLQEYGNYDWLTSSGSFVILNNGIEFSITYFVMLLMLFFAGAGRYLSVDYWIAKKMKIPHTEYQ